MGTPPHRIRGPIETVAIHSMPPITGDVTVHGSVGVPAIGQKNDPQAITGNGSVIAILKRLRTLISLRIPALLGPWGGMQVEDVTLMRYRRTDNRAVAQTDRVLLTPVADRAIRLVSLILSTDTAMWIEFEVNNIDVVPPIYLPANGSGNILFKPPLALNANEVLTYTSSAAGNHSVAAYGWEE